MHAKNDEASLIQRLSLHKPLSNDPFRGRCFLAAQRPPYHPGGVCSNVVFRDGRGEKETHFARKTLLNAKCPKRLQSNTETHFRIVQKNVGGIIPPNIKLQKGTIILQTECGSLRSQFSATQIIAHCVTR